jgi:hypothetical protein
MKRRVIIISMTIIVITVYIFRVRYVYNNSIKSKDMIFSIGDEVQIEDDYFDSSAEKMMGYSVQVLDYDIIPINEFKVQYPDYNNDLRADYILLIKAKFKNFDNAYGNSAGIDLGQYILQNRSFVNYIDRNACSILNGFDTLKFSLRVDSEKELTIPFRIDSFYINADDLNNGYSQLVVSLYIASSISCIKERIYST